jgi:hypothetical protein
VEVGSHLSNLKNYTATPCVDPKAKRRRAYRSAPHHTSTKPALLDRTEQYTTLRRPSNQPHRTCTAAAHHRINKLSEKEKVCEGEKH